jgi:hypothetical protein
MGKLKIRSTSDIEQVKRSILLVGPPGSGKTYFWLTCPSPFGIIFDRNMGTLMNELGIPYVIPESVRQYKTEILPAVQNRKLTELVREIDGFEDYTVQTVVEDSGTSKGYFIRDSLTDNDKRVMERDLWQDYLGTYRTSTHVMTGATRPMPSSPDRECYNYILTCHEKIVTDEKGNVVDITTMLEGQYKTGILQEFDCVFVTEAKSKSSPEGGRSVRWQMWTVPPDKHRTVLDRVGGKRYNTLPPKVPNDYNELAKLWGLGDNQTRRTEK